MKSLLSDRRPPVLYLLLVILFLVPGCNLPALPGGILPGDPPSSAPPQAEVTFSVLIPINTPIEETIYLSTLDEVTGLGVNAQAHAMQPVLDESDPGTGLTYRTSLTVPVGTTLKYRYTRQNQYAAIEHTQTDTQVRYRMLHVDGPKTVQDVVFKWSDTDYNGDPPGRISGTITSGETGEPLSDVLVTAGGVQSLTTANGTYLLSGLPPGVHNLVAYALDGGYGINQQGAQVASQANTQADLSLQPRDFVDVTFVVDVPPGTPENSLRMAGNLHQLGNTFGNLAGGMNTIPTRMPRLTSIGLNQYGVILSLPAGAEIRYKYTLGDGFWNAEHTAGGDFRVRRLIVPSQSTQITDEVEAWSDGEKGPITFDLVIPQDTPEDEDIYIQLNPYGWTAPLPMTKIDPHHWAYILYSPFDIISDLSYRYCREGECRLADDLATHGETVPGRLTQPETQSTYLADTVQGWAWYEPNPGPAPQPPGDIPARGEDFLTGIEFMKGDRPAHADHIEEALKALPDLGANTAVLSPTWTFTHQQTPVLEPDLSQDLSWYDLRGIFQQASDQELEVALFPKPHFPSNPETWWATAPRDFSWWNSWFDQYHHFALHFAQLAEVQGVETLVLGGRWLAPALPGGKLSDGSPSGVPADADLRWKAILEDVQARFDGQLAWAGSVPDSPTSPDFFQLLDLYYLDWSPPLSEAPEASPEAWSSTAAELLTQGVKPFWTNGLEENDIQLVLMVGYPSITTSSQPCVSPARVPEDPDCLTPRSLDTPAPDLPEVERDLSAQAGAYQAVLSALSGQDWVSGVVSRGYYAPVVLHDKSISIHGKPAQQVVTAWFRGFHP